MQKLDRLKAFSVLLIFLAGIVVGQGFSFEVKLSDLIALTAVLITFWYAKSGLNRSESIYLNSINPIIQHREIFDRTKCEYRLDILNCGSGSAVNIQTEYTYDGQNISQSELQNIFCGDVFSNREVGLGMARGLTPNSSDILIYAPCNNLFDFEELINHFRKTQINIECSSSQGQQFTYELILGLGYNG
ncbi:hypothetical protein [Pseudoalteromonas sp. Z1A6]|uniref:hypothetical protein n=1 Tax=Pseudoalteromonas sp. Z1A6 TaxID=2686349 RepID=UPI0013FD8EA7|nr:hypothetical protein [Pseudoalteromonas sp. Z1A6]